MKNKNKKEEWAKSLRVGDRVENCRFEVHQVVKVCPKYICPMWAMRILFFLEDYFGLDISHGSKVERWLISHHMGMWVDTDLQLENGAWCSAMHCCDPVPSPTPHTTATPTTTKENS